MTEAEWLACDDWDSMLVHIGGKGFNRKLLLLAVALCRHVWDHFPFDECRQIVEAVERLADHPDVDGTDYRIVAEVNNLFATVQEAHHLVRVADIQARGAYLAALNCGGMWHDPDGNIEGVANAIAFSLGKDTEGPVWEAERLAQAKLLHDLFGNPFRPVAFDLRWRSDTAVSLASGIYAERAFDRLPILADALEEAGCDHPDVLSHCRGPGPHVRGCWVVDGVLGKT